MRYTCNICNKFVKDKFLLGLLHFCNRQELSSEDINILHKKLNEILLPELPNESNSPQIEEYNKLVRLFR